MTWIQQYDPLGHMWLSTAVAAFPIVLLLVALAVFEWRAHAAAGAALAAALVTDVDDSLTWVRASRTARRICAIREICGCQACLTSPW